MLIDWFTVGAQALNFLILVWLLRRFLYKPIRTAIDAREKRIADALADAAARQTEAQQQRDELQARNKAFDEQRGALLDKAAAEGKAARDLLIAEARSASDSLRARQASALQGDRSRLCKDLSRLAAEEVFAITRKTLAELATASVEERMSEMFSSRLRTMSAAAKQAMATALRGQAGPALLRSRFELPAAQRAAIQNALNESFAADIQLRFETVPDALCGIELTANGQKLAWSIAEYLRGLEQKAAALIDAQATPQPEPPARPAPEPKAAAAAAAAPAPA
jgi:F-type H+-transporting ATPase subunit b